MKIWGVRAGLIGDLIMALPILEYLEIKHPKSYKYWAVHQKCAQAAPLFLNHPLIDKIKITDGWVTEAGRDENLKKECNIKFDISPPVRDPNWRNEMSCIEQTARMAGIDDLYSVIDEEQRIPSLTQWFPSYTFSNNPINHGYVDDIESLGYIEPNRIAIWPFANYMMKLQRSPNQGWWEATISLLIKAGYEVYHYGWMEEPVLSHDEKYQRCCELSFFDQIRSSLESVLSIGTDSGSMWVLGAYKQPQIVLMTYHEAGHNDNPLALAPPYKNSTTMFNPNNINLIRPASVIALIEHTLMNEQS